MASVVARCMVSLGSRISPKIFKLEYLCNEVRARGGGWEWRVDVEGGQSWAGSVLATASFVEGRCLEESHDFCLLCVDLHTISDTPFLADI